MVDILLGLLRHVGHSRDNVVDMHMVLLELLELDDLVLIDSNSIRLL